MAWFRFYDDTMDDSKLDDMDAQECWLWVVILSFASRSPIRGKLLVSEGVPVPIQSIAKRAKMKTSRVESSFQRLVSQKMIDKDVQGVWCVLNWSQRQYQSDLSTERVRQYRKRNGNVSLALPKRQGTVAETAPDTDTDTDTDIKQGGIAPDVTDGERQTLAVLKTIANYAFDYQKDLQHIRALAVDYPNIDLLDECKRWATYKLDHPLEKKSNPRSQLRTWFRNAVEYGRARKPLPTPATYQPKIERADAEFIALHKHLYNGGGEDG